VGLIADLGRGPVGLDTAVVIYFMQEHPRFLPVVAPIFSAIEHAGLSAVTSAITLIETLASRTEWTGRGPLPPVRHDAGRWGA
jgi:hypothetical protein